MAEPYSNHTFAEIIKVTGVWDKHYKDMPGKTVAQQCLNVGTLMKRHQMHQTVTYRNMALEST
jgi:hypothetical protein